jgi:hypothetical protein
MDTDQFNKIAGGLQSIITALGIAVGGIWVLFTFQYLGTAEKSRAELAELDLNNTKPKRHWPNGSLSWRLI